MNRPCGNIQSSGSKRRRTAPPQPFTVAPRQITPFFDRLHPALLRQAMACILVVTLAVLSTGCATTRQIKSIVAESDAATFAAQIADVDLSGDPAAPGNPPDWQAVSRKIDEFIAGHPDQPVAAGALRVRQAILLLAHRQFELARSAFGEARELKTDRDKALQALADPLIWWWQHASDNFWQGAVLGEAPRQLERFDKVIPGLEGSPDIRDLLAEMRARLGLKLAKDSQLAQGKRDRFIEALNRYGAIFTTNDIAVIRAGNLSPQSPAIATEEKRRLRALAVIEKAKPIAQALQAAGQPVTAADLKSDPAIQGLGGLVLAP